MLARHAVLLTPLEYAVPSIILYSKQRPPVTSLESALTSHSQPTENTATLSPVECALTRLSPATPLECAVPEKTGEGAHSFHSGNSPPQANARGHSFTLSGADRRFRPCRKGPLITRHNSQVLSFHILAHSFALFCTPQKLNSLLFNRFRTLCQKTPRVGVPCGSYALASLLHRESHTSCFLSLAGACEPAWASLPTLPFQPSTVDSQPPLRPSSYGSRSTDHAVFLASILRSLPYLLLPLQSLRFHPEGK